jgi:hypothetical protein
MRAKWLDRDLLQATQGRLGFTATQGRRIRIRLGVVGEPNLATYAPNEAIAESMPLPR